MNNLKNLRKAKKLSQAEVAKALGLTRQALCNYENDLREPDFATLQKMSEFFKVSVDFIMDIDNSTNFTETTPGETPLTDGEKALLELFNQVPKEQQQLVVDLVAVALKNLK